MLVNPWQYIVAKYFYDAFGNVLFRLWPYGATKPLPLFEQGSPS
jgi:hypothetical protein